MAIVHRADLRPPKLELIGGWLPSQPWYRGAAPPQLEALGAYRFDDPDGEVGIETHLLRTDDGLVLQVPLTYRGAPLPGGDPWLLGTMEHSVLGRRWAYDGCGDPVYATVLAATILGGGTEAEELLEVDGRQEPRRPSASVRGSGSPGDALAASAVVGELTCTTDGVTSVVDIAEVHLRVRRVVDVSPAATATRLDGAHLLTGTWAGQDEPVLLATARLPASAAG
jgi:hypothetical protein